MSITRNMTYGNLPPTVYPEVAVKQLLTRRELEILDLIRLDASNKQIADHLYITEGTVKSHIHSILRKMGVKRRTQL